MMVYMSFAFCRYLWPRHVAMRRDDEDDHHDHVMVVVVWQMQQN